MHLHSLREISGPVRTANRFFSLTYKQNNHSMKIHKINFLYFRTFIDPDKNHNEMFNNVNLTNLYLSIFTQHFTISLVQCKKWIKLNFKGEYMYMIKETLSATFQYPGNVYQQLFLVLIPIAYYSACMCNNYYCLQWFLLHSAWNGLHMCIKENVFVNTMTQNFWNIEWGILSTHELN